MIATTGERFFNKVLDDALTAVKTTTVEAC